MYLLRSYMQKQLELNFLIGWKFGFSEGAVLIESKVDFGQNMGADVGKSLEWYWELFAVGKVAV